MRVADCSKKNLPEWPIGGPSLERRSCGEANIEHEIAACQRRVVHEVFFTDAI